MLQPGQRVSVRSAYAAMYPDPISGAAGEAVHLTGEEDAWQARPEWRWCKCTDARGKSGWVPASYLVAEGRVGRLLRAYSARELSVAERASVTVVEYESGWYWVHDAQGQAGWVPSTCLEPPDAQLQPA